MSMLTQAFTVAAAGPQGDETSMRAVTASDASSAAAGIVCIVCGAGMVFGKEMASLTLARGLRDGGWDPRFVTSWWNDGDFVRRLQRESFPFGQVWLGFISASLRIKPILMTLDQMRYWPALAYRYNRLIATTKPRAVIHTNWHHAVLLLPLLDPRRDILWLHDLFPISRRYACMLTTVAKRVGRVVCVSSAVARNAVALGVP